MGVEGVIRVLNHIGMIETEVTQPGPSFEAHRSRWIRARQSGVFRLQVRMGDTIHKNSVVGVIGDPFGNDEVFVRAPFDGVVVGHVINPLVHRGEAVVHLAECK